VWLDIRDVSLDVTEALRGLNNRFAQETSWLEAGDWVQMQTHAFAAIATRDVNGFLMSFDQSAGYDSRNFLWLKERFERFVYIDRVVVDPAAQGQGIGRRLYEALAVRARAAGHERIVCEVNTLPDNAASHRFHERAGFTPVAEVEWEPGVKAVRFYEWRLASE